jgi:hypothetical protein
MSDQLNDDEAVPEHIMGIFIKMAEAIHGKSHGDVIIAMGVLLNHMADGDRDIIIRAVEHLINVALNTYSETAQ